MGHRGPQRKQKAFLAAFAECGVLTHAAEAAGIGVRRHYDWMDSAKYRAKYEAATLASHDALEREARRRAIDGVRQDVYFKGDVVGSKQVYSDSLLQFLLKGALPDKYADRKQISGKDGGPLEICEELVYPGDDPYDADETGLF